MISYLFNEHVFLYPELILCMFINLLIIVYNFTTFRICYDVYKRKYVIDASTSEAYVGFLYSLAL